MAGPVSDLVRLDGEDPEVLLARAESLKARPSLKARVLGIFGGSLDSCERLQAASEAYEQAARVFLMRNLKLQARSAYVRSAETQLEARDCDAFVDRTFADKRIARQYAHAAACCAEDSLDDACGHVNQAVSYFSRAGDFSAAMREMQTVAERYTKANQPQAAIARYTQALKLCELHSTQSSSGNSLEYGRRHLFLEMARLHIATNAYRGALDVYLSLLDRAAESHILRLDISDFAVHAALCFMLMEDEVGLEQCGAITEALNPMDDTFIRGITGAISAGDLDAFEAAVQANRSLRIKPAPTLQSLLAQLRQRVGSIA